MKQLLLYAVIIFLTFNSCTSSRKETPEKPSYGGNLRIAYYKEPESLNPLESRNTASTYLETLIFSSLVKYNADRKIKGDIAEEWTVSEDGLVWTLKLKKGITFHDGEPLTAADVIFTYESHINSPITQRSFLVIDKISSDEDYSVSFTLQYPYAPFGMLLTYSILPKHILSDPSKTEGFSKHPVGSGPFVFKSWSANRIELEANKRYHDNRPFLDGVSFIRLMNTDAAWSALLRKEIDLVEEIDELDYGILEQEEQNYQVYSYITNFYYALVFNLENPLFSKPEMRKAIQACVDRDDLMRNTIIGGHGTITSGPLHPATESYNRNVQSQSFDPEMAEELLAEQGWENTDSDPFLEKDGLDLSLTVISADEDRLKDELIERLKWQLLRQGIKTETTSYTQRKLFEKRLIPGDFQAVLLRYNHGGHPDQSLTLFWHSKNTGLTNIPRYSNNRIDNLIEKARSEMDPELRKRYYHEIHSIIAEDAPAAFLFFLKKNIGISSRIGGVQVFPGSYHQTIADWYIKEQ
jgi:peptide/nickel transport system substrate-binding protein